MVSWASSPAQPLWALVPLALGLAGCGSASPGPDIGDALTLDTALPFGGPQGRI